MLKLNMTPEDFAAQGITLDVAFDPKPFNCRNPSEYWKRIRAGLPTSAPAAKIGDWYWSPIAKCNLRVLSVTWDTGVHRWRYGVVGFSSPEFYAPHTDAANVECERLASGAYRLLAEKA